MYHFGIIGQPLEHSFSAKYFTEKFRREEVDADYQLCPIPKASLIEDYMGRFDGFNVTYPYKEVILQHLSALDNVASEIGAVNVVCHGK
jgi:shikimate dehydrogenase